MKINKTQNGTNLEIALEGRLDTATAPELEKELTGSLEGLTGLTLDFAGLEYISSAGLRVLLMAQRALRGAGKVKVVNANDIVKEVFDVTGFSDILTVE